MAWYDCLDLFTGLSVELVNVVVVVILIILPTIVTLAMTVSEEGLIGIEIQIDLPRVVDTYIEEEANKNQCDSGACHTPLIGGDIGQRRYDTYHVVPADAPAILRLDEEQQYATEYQGSIGHHNLGGCSGDNIIVLEDEVVINILLLPKVLMGTKYKGSSIIAELWKLKPMNTMLRNIFRFLSDTYLMESHTKLAPRI